MRSRKNSSSLHRDGYTGRESDSEDMSQSTKRDRVDSIKKNLHLPTIKAEILEELIEDDSEVDSTQKLQKLKNLSLEISNKP
jgi:hypothetical protein